MTTVDEQRGVLGTEDGFRTVEEQADFLKVPVRTLYAWHHRGIGPRPAKIGRFLRYRVSETERWLAEQARVTSGTGPEAA